MNALRFGVVALALVIPVAIAALVATNTPVEPPARVQLAKRARAVGVAPAKAAVQLDLAASLHTHKQLMVDAGKVKVSDALGAAINKAQDEAALPPDPTLQVPDARKIAVFYTGSAIGETDPCG